ncbi:hypothetical protein [Streptomyces sp. NPDC090445]|uniref:hypothetical protein n=1 Tax=Streptomyces sp. NPDC090445 TaxID=3365963 RepID=UPI0037F127D1
MSEQTDAATALQGIARIEATAKGRSGWYNAYLWVFAAWQLIVVPAVLLWQGPTGTVVSTLANALVVMGLSVFATRQPVVPHGFGGRHLKVIGVWTVVYLSVLAAGLTVFRDSVAFAAVAALACAAPAAVTAWREARAV